MTTPAEAAARGLFGDLVDVDAAPPAPLEPPHDTCDRCGRLYLVWPGYSFGLCGLHTVEFEIEITQAEAER